MIDINTIRNTIIGSLYNHLGFLIIESSSVNEKPDYPYFSFTITTLYKSEFENPREESTTDTINTFEEDGNVVFSFKSLSNDSDESRNNALKAYKFFKFTGVESLYENGISVKKVTNVANRNILLVEEYEKIEGFDVIFRVESSITQEVINIEEANIDVNT